VTIRVVIADDQALVRGGFVVMVGAAPDMAVLGQAADGAEAVALIRQHHPDVVLMDIRMPVLDGIEATRAITTDPDTAAARVLMLTTFDLDDYVYRALRAGASGFLLKDTAPEELLAAIRTLAAGDALLAPGITRRLIREFASRPEPGAYSSPRLLESLSARERELLSHLAACPACQRDLRAYVQVARMLPRGTPSASCACTKIRFQMRASRWLSIFGR